MKTSLKTKLLATSILITAIYGNALATVIPPLPPGPTVPPGPTIVTLDASKTKSNVGLEKFTQTTTNGATDTTIIQGKTSNNIAKFYLTSIDTGASDTLTYVQPNSNSVAINYITYGSPTNFAGKLNANGKVAIINNAGITFAAGSQVNVGALLTATGTSFAQFGTGSGELGINDDIYAPVAKDYYLVEGFTNSPINLEGEINAKDYVIALSNQINVADTAKIKVDNGGKIFLSGGTSRYTINMTNDGNPLVYASLSRGKSSNVNVNGTLTAPDGHVSLIARGTDMATSVVNLKGVVDVSNLSSLVSTKTLDDGVSIRSAGDVNIDNSITATGVSKGGNIKISAGRYLKVDAPLDVSSSAGSAGSVHLISGKDMLVGKNIFATGFKNAAGDVTLTSGGLLQLDGNIDTSNGGGKQAGDVALKSTGVMTVNGKIVADSTDATKDGDIKTTSDAYVKIATPSGNTIPAAALQQVPVAAGQQLADGSALDVASVLIQAVYQDSPTITGFTLPGGGLPTGWTLVSSKLNPSFKIPVPTGYSIVNVTKNNTATGYFAVALYNSSTKSLIVVNRGLDSTSPTDLAAAEKDGGAQATAAVQFLAASLKLAGNPSPSNILVTGHSLGGPLAVAQESFLAENGLATNSLAITFDSIGDHFSSTGVSQPGFLDAAEVQYRVQQTVAAHTLDFNGSQQTISVGGQDLPIHAWAPTGNVLQADVQHDPENWTPYILANYPSSI